MKSTSKGSGKKRKNVFVPDIKAKKKQVFERTFDYLSKTLGNLTDAIKDDSLQLFVEFLRENGKRQKRRDKMFMAMMQRFTMGPPQHMQQPLSNFNTLNNIDIQGSFSQPAPVYGTNSAAFSPIWPSTCKATSTSNNSTSGDVLDHFFTQNTVVKLIKNVKIYKQLKFALVKYYLPITLHHDYTTLLFSLNPLCSQKKVVKDSLMAVAVLSLI